MESSRREPGESLGVTEKSQGVLYGGRYRLVAALGRGGMGAVFEARDEQTGRRVAVKVLRAKVGKTDGTGTAQRFGLERWAGARVKHPNVVEVLDAGVDETTGERFIVQELLEGGDLGEVLERRGRIPVDELIALMAPAIDGVAAAHAVGVVHRDLKPSNIFLVSRPDGGVSAKVIDFGIARVRGTGPHEAPLVSPDVLLGTPAYMSPEQVRAEADLDGRTDVWSLGVLLFEAASGSLPFVSQTASGLLRAIATEAPRKLAEVAPWLPEGFTAVVDRALARDPDARFATVTALATALRECSLTTPSQRPTADTRPWKALPPIPAAVSAGVRRSKSRRREPAVSARSNRNALRALAVLTAVVVLGVLAAFGWWALHRSAPLASPVGAREPSPEVRFAKNTSGDGGERVMNAAGQPSSSATSSSAPPMYFPSTNTCGVVALPLTARSRRGVACTSA